MHKTHLIWKFIAASMLSVALVPVSKPVLGAREPRPAFLFDTQCVTNGPGRSREETLDVAVDRKVYRSYLFLGPGSREASITCRILPEDADDSTLNFQRLQLEFGMRDNDRGSPPNTVNIYLDGVRADSATLSPGEKKSVVLDVSNVTNVSIETVCSSQARYCDRVYFFDATLEPVILPPIESIPEQQTESPMESNPASNAESPMESNSDSNSEALPQL